MGRKGEVNCRNIKLREFDVKIKADMIEEKGNCDQGLRRCFYKRREDKELRYRNVSGAGKCGTVK